MEFLNGFKPGAPETQSLTDEERDRLVDLGAASIIRMLFRDGFFHADLHPGNLLVLPGPRLGFIDLGMVGRFDSDLRRTFLYYYYTLVMGDAEGAARYLGAIAQPGPGGRPQRVPPRGHRDPAALEPRSAASATSRSPSSSCAR